MTNQKTTNAIRIALTNQKGGVGKTTNTFNLAHILAERGYKTLCVDHDPQGNLSRAMLGAQEIENGHVANIYNEINLTPITLNERLDFIGSNGKLALVQDKGVNMLFCLADYLDKVDEKYDIILIDCLPSLNILLTASLVAATHIIIPTVLDMFSVEGFTDLFSTIQSIRKPHFNPNLKILGIICNKVRNPMTTLASEMEELIRERYNQLVFENKISDRVVLQESPVSSQAITIYSPKHKSAQEFNNLVDEILQRLSSEITFQKNVSRA